MDMGLYDKPNPPRRPFKRALDTADDVWGLLKDLFSAYLQGRNNLDADTKDKLLTCIGLAFVLYTLFVMEKKRDG